MDQIDERRRKPRRTRGTPVYYYRNRVSLGVLFVAIATFGLFSITPVFRKFNNEFVKSVYKNPEDNLNKEDLLSMFRSVRPSQEIRQDLEEQKLLNEER